MIDNGRAEAGMGNLQQVLWWIDSWRSCTGATIVGTGMQLYWDGTGSKTLSKIGMGMSLAGGIGQGFNAVRDLLTSGLGGSAVRSSSARLARVELMMCFL